MNQFEQNHPQELENFLTELHHLIDNYHANLYMINEVYDGLGIITRAVSDEINLVKQK